MRRSTADLIESTATRLIQEDADFLLLAMEPIQLFSQRTQQSVGVVRRGDHSSMRPVDVPLCRFGSRFSMPGQVATRRSFGDHRHRFVR